MLTFRDVELLKSEGRYYHAGALAAALGGLESYGCHYGMKSTRYLAATAFIEGFRAAERDLCGAARRA